MELLITALTTIFEVTLAILIIPHVPNQSGRSFADDLEVHSWRAIRPSSLPPCVLLSHAMELSQWNLLVQKLFLILLISVLLSMFFQLLLGLTSLHGLNSYNKQNNYEHIFTCKLKLICHVHMNSYTCTDIINIYPTSLENCKMFCHLCRVCFKQ